MVIKFKLRNLGLTPPEIIKKGDWIDLYVQEDVRVCKDVPVKINFKIAVELPKGFEAHVVSRSSTFSNYGIIQTNAVGIIDNSYNGNDDEWKGQYYPTRDCLIPRGARIAQFRIMLSQKATFWQKLKWLFSNKIKLKWVNTLKNKNRGGFGEATGK